MRQCTALANIPKEGSLPSSRERMMKLVKITKSQWVALGAFVLILFAEVLYFGLDIRDNGGSLYPLLMLSSVCLIALLGIFALLKSPTISIEAAFLVSLIFLGICYIAVIGPLKSNDETSHYIGAYWLSNTLLGFDMSSIPMREDDFEFYQKWRAVTLEHKDQFTQLHDSFSFLATNADLVTYADNLNKNPLNSPVQMYFFPALGLTLGRLIGLGAVPAYYLGRLLALGSFGAIAYIAVRNTPLGKPAFMVMGLLPMTIELSSSFSYDGPTIAMAMLLAAFCFKAIYSTKQSRSTLIVVAAASVILVPLKVVYSTIILLVLAFPANSFPSKKNATLYKTLVICACIAVFCVTRLGAATEIATSSVTSFSITGDYDAYTLSDLMAHPLWAAHVFLNSFFERLDFKLLTYLGANMGQNNLSPICNISASIGFFLLMLYALNSKSPEKKPGPRIIILCLTGLIASALAIELTMFIGNATRGSDVIIGTLGRYFIPLTPLLIPLFANTKLSIAYPTPKIILYGAFCLNAFYVIDIYGFIALAQ